MFKFIENFKENKELRERVNTLENENKVLKNDIINILLNKFNENETTKRLREDSKRLRQKIKDLKELSNEERDKREKKKNISGK